MANGIWLAIVALISAAITGPIATIAVHIIQAKQKRQETRDKETREDVVSARVTEAADKLLARQDSIAAQAAEAAKLLIESNKEVASIARDSAVKTDEKLEVIDQGQKEIHTLVNSSMTAAMQGELLATSGQYAMMVEVLDLKKTQGHQPTVEALAALETTRARVEDLTTQLEGRRLAQIKADEEKAKLADQGKVEVVVQGRMP